MCYVASLKNEGSFIGKSILLSARKKFASMVEGKTILRVYSWDLSVFDNIERSFELKTIALGQNKHAVAELNNVDFEIKNLNLYIISFCLLCSFIWRYENIKCTIWKLTMRKLIFNLDFQKTNNYNFVLQLHSKFLKFILKVFIRDSEVKLHPEYLTNWIRAYGFGFMNGSRSKFTFWLMLWFWPHFL